MRIAKSSTGFSLVEVMIVVGILSISAAAFMALMDFTLRGGTEQKFRGAADVAEAEVRSLLSSPVACANSLQHLDLNTAATDAVPVQTLKDASGAVTYKLNQPDTSGTYLFGGMTVSNAAPVINNSGRVTLNLRLVSVGKTLGAAQVPRVINLATSFDASNRLTGCVALAKMSDGIWQMVPNTAYDIFYVGAPTGNVGINTAVPQAQLHVNGKIWGQPDCHTVQVDGGPPHYISVANCAANEFLLNGGGLCANLGGYGFGSPTSQGYLHATFPIPNGWNVDCFDPVNNIDVPSRAIITCCRNGS